MNETCKNCCWWKEWDGREDTGDCRKRSPISIFSQEDGTHGTAFPYTKVTDFCGEFKQ